VHSIDRFTANQCNRVLGRGGGLWQREPYDHWIRSPEELEQILLYVEGNPVKSVLKKGSDPLDLARILHVFLLSRHSRNRGSDPFFNTL
jgi:hypothetical protein